MSSVVLLREMAQDETQDIAVRVGCLRKFFEHTVSEPRDNSPAYNILSSLIHGRDYPSIDNEGLVPMQRDSIDCGNLAIREYVPTFDYARMLALCELHISATLERQFRDDLNTATAVLEHKNGGI